MNKILITSALSSLGLRVSKLLKDKYELTLASSSEIPSVLQGNYQPLVEASNLSFFHIVLTMALDNNCQFVLPLEQAEIVALSESTTLFEEYGITILAPNRTQLAEINVLENPNKEFELVLLADGKDLISNRIVEIYNNGLGILSDSEVDFVLTVSK